MLGPWGHSWSSELQGLWAIKGLGQDFWATKKLYPAVLRGPTGLHSVILKEPGGARD